jgi:DNA polymerase III alpha subunit
MASRLPATRLIGVTDRRMNRAVAVDVAFASMFRRFLSHGLARSKLTETRAQRLGPALLFGLQPAREMNEQRLAELVEHALPARFAETGRGEPSAEVRARAAEEVSAICSSGIADLVLFSHEVGRFCAQCEIPLTARGSATSSLVIWAR